MDLKLVKGVGPKRVTELNKMGINCVEDLVDYFPRDYLDLTHITPISEAYHNDIVLTVGRIERDPVVSYKGSLSYLKAQCSQQGCFFQVVWFNSTYMEKMLKRDSSYLFYGRVSNKNGYVSLTNPSFEELGNNVKLKGIVPVYSRCGTISQRTMNKLVLEGLAVLKPKSVIPEYLEKKYKLAPLMNAYYDVHDPSSIRAKDKASERIAVERYFRLISSFKIIKGDKNQGRINKYTTTGADLREFSKRFGFEFTQGQKNAINDIFKDLKSNFVMNRLLQGDVGCGKTAVSICTMFMALSSGHQCALLAPTEVLAEQNYKIATKYLSEYNPVFLSGRLTVKQKKEVKEKIKSGEAKVVVGTHAILTGDVEFLDLTLCICDEQQRFGVGQRSALLAKGSVCDMLVMSATPIPRTFSLIFFGDLDVSTIPDKPKDRIEIKTYIVPSHKYEGMLGFIKKEIDEGRQAYFVCPKIEGDEDDVYSVTELYKEICDSFSDYRVGLLHGKLSNDEKVDVMNNFKEGITNILVSTTVIEVGVDVPNSTVMVIMNAERFGLSQLHQLRGRVGRGSYQSYCFLVCGKENEKSLERLRALKDNSDGFKISEIDYDIRGGGDFLGTRQSGRMASELGNLRYPLSSIMFAKKISDEAFENPDNIQLLNIIAKKEEERLKDVSLN